MSDHAHPHWVVEMKIEPRSAVDTERLAFALVQLASEDPTFGYSKHPQSGESIVMGVGEVELDAQLGALKHRCSIDVQLGAPRVRYRETLARSAEIDYTRKKQTRDAGEFARVKLRLEPNEPGAGNEFGNETAAGAVPKEYVPSVERGVQAVWETGVLIGFPMIDTKVTLFGGAYHEKDSSAIVFEIAARTAMQEGATKAGVKLLEPIMDLEVVTPGDFVGSVIGDINGRRGHIGSLEMRGNGAVIQASVSLAHLFGYTSWLGSSTNGRANCTMRFSHFTEVQPKNGPDTFPPAVGMRA